jgi:hypothetical protein
MKTARVIPVLAAVLTLGACVTADTCEEPEFYEMAQGGKRIDAPDDLDELSPGKERVIPEASPRPPRDRSSGCLDRPPTLRIDDDGSATESS